MAISYDDRLPARRPPLIGRERELAEARDHLLDAPERILTLTGVGGCGKTSLALQLAADVRASFPDGVFLVELASVNDAGLIVPTIAAAVGLHDVRGQTLMDVLVSLLQPRDLLLVLDNCEHLVDACAELADGLLTLCPRLRILATSREPLLIAGERQRRIAPLPVPEPDQQVAPEALSEFSGVQLFLQRAQAAEPAFHLTNDNAAAVATICATLDGIPLGLELAAARLRVLTVDQIAARMDDWFRLLAVTSRSAPTRQQTLRATLDWSFDLLTPAERAVLCRLSAFPGGASLEGAEGVCAGDGVNADDVLDLLARLVDKSLVLVDTSGEVAWYRELEPIRQYAQRRLSEAGELDDVLDRHADFYLAFAEAAAPRLTGPEQIAWLARLDREQGNLRAAVRRLAERGDVEAELRLEIALTPFWEAHGHLGESRGYLEASLAAAEASGAPPALRMKALTGAGRIAHLQTDFIAAEALHQRSLDIAREIGDRRGVVDALTELGREARLQDHCERSIALLEESLALCRELGEPPATAAALRDLGITAWALSDFRRSQQLLEESLELYLADGHLRQIAITRSLLGLTALDAGNIPLATACYTEALVDHQRIGDWWFIIYVLQGLAGVLVETGQAQRAARLFGAAHALGEAHGETLLPIGVGTYERFVEKVKAQLHDQAFAAAWAQGVVLSRDEAVREALEAAAQVEMRLKEPVAERGIPDGLDALTPREFEVAMLLTRGYTDRQIADVLSIAVSTVGVHVHHILEKLDLRSRHQVADWAAEHGLLDTSAAQDAPQLRPGRYHSTESL